jgi:hypothetical protein
MKKSFLSLKRIILIICAGLALLAGSLGFYYFSPYSVKHREATRFLQQFYPPFMEEDYGAIAGLTDDGNPQFIINVRHFYGDARKYQILYIRDKGENRKKAYVRVTTIKAGKTKHYNDTLYLVKIKEEWKLQSYDTINQIKLP